MQPVHLDPRFPWTRALLSPWCVHQIRWEELPSNHLVQRFPFKMSINHIRRSLVHYRTESVTRPTENLLKSLAQWQRDLKTINLQKLQQVQIIIPYPICMRNFSQKYTNTAKAINREMLYPHILEISQQVAGWTTKDIIFYVELVEILTPYPYLEASAVVVSDPVWSEKNISPESDLKFTSIEWDSFFTPKM